MKTRYLITYDICDDDRRTKVYQTLRGWGEHLQFSVFRCDLSAASRARLVAELHPMIDHSCDQILIVDLGPVEGRAATCIQSLGQRYIPPERLVTIL